MLIGIDAGHDFRRQKSIAAQFDDTAFGDVNDILALFSGALAGESDVLDLIHPTLRDVTLFHETLNKARQPFRITIGEPIAASALPASEALAMATINGARALGMEERIGSLEVGKQADLIAVDLGGPETQPLYNPISQLVYACNGSQVSHSWIAGQPVLEARELTRIDLSSLAARARSWQQKIHDSRPGK